MVSRNMSESPAFSAALRRIDPTKNMARFYAVGVQLTLFGEWAVVKRWGRINTEGRRAEEWFTERDEALSAAKSPRSRQAGSGLRERRQVGPYPWRSGAFGCNGSQSLRSWSPAGMREHRRPGDGGMAARRRVDRRRD